MTNINEMLRNWEQERFKRKRRHHTHVHECARLRTELSRIEKSTGTAIRQLSFDISGLYRLLLKSRNLHKVISISSSRHIDSNLRWTILGRRQRKKTKSGIVRALVVVMGHRGITSSYHLHHVLLSCTTQNLDQLPGMK